MRKKNKNEGKSSRKVRAMEEEKKVIGELRALKRELAPEAEEERKKEETRHKERQREIEAGKKTVEDLKDAERNALRAREQMEEEIARAEGRLKRLTAAREKMREGLRMWLKKAEKKAGSARRGSKGRKNS